MKQNMEALAWANERRLAAARAKRELRAGNRSLESVLRDPMCGGARVAQVLQAQYKWGPQRVAALMGHVGVGLQRRVEDLTDRQVDVIVRAAQLPQSEWWTVQRKVAA